LSEWGNLMLITTTIGVESNNDLKAANPSAQFINLIATFFQGVAQGVGMLIRRNNSSRNKALIANNELEAREWLTANKRALIQSNAAVVALTGGLCIPFYFAREQLADFFLANASNSEIKELAETYLWMNIIALIPDAIRIVSAGALRGWQDILYPTM